MARKWGGDIRICTGKKVFVNAGVFQGSHFSRAADRNRSHYGCTTVVSLAALRKFSAVLELQQLGRLICQLKYQRLERIGPSIKIETG